jgi:hypothetical protein
LKTQRKATYKESQEVSNTLGNYRLKFKVGLETPFVLVIPTPFGCFE